MAAAPEPLAPAAVAQALDGLAGWYHQDDALLRTLTFGTFREAFGFLVGVAFAAEAAGHHPEITNVYNRVTLRLTTHDAGDRVTARDVALARALSLLADR